MPSDLENLQTARSNIAANLAAITASPKPNYTIDGQTVSWQALFDSYVNQIKNLDVLIAGEGGPFEIASEGRT